MDSLLRACAIGTPAALLALALYSSPILPGPALALCGALAVAAALLALTF